MHFFDCKYFKKLNISSKHVRNSVVVEKKTKFHPSFYLLKKGISINPILTHAHNIPIMKRRYPPNFKFLCL